MQMVQYAPSARPSQLSLLVMAVSALVVLGGIAALTLSIRHIKLDDYPDSEIHARDWISGLVPDDARDIRGYVNFPRFSCEIRFETDDEPGFRRIIERLSDPIETIEEPGASIFFPSDVRSNPSQQIWIDEGWWYEHHVNGRLFGGGGFNRTTKQGYHYVLLP